MTQDDFDWEDQVRQLQHQNRETRQQLEDAWARLNETEIRRREAQILVEWYRENTVLLKHQAGVTR